MKSTHPKKISEIPKDLDLKVATKKEALWMKVRDTAKERIETLSDDLEVNKEVIKLAEKIIKEENAS